MEWLVGIAALIGLGIFFFVLELPDILKQKSKDQAQIAENNRKAAEASLEAERLKSNRHLPQ